MALSFYWTAVGYPECNENECLSILKESSKRFNTLEMCTVDYYTENIQTIEFHNKGIPWSIKFLANQQLTGELTENVMDDNIHLRWVAYVHSYCEKCKDVHYIEKDAARDEQYFGDVSQCLTDFQTNSIIDRYNPRCSFTIMFEVWQDTKPVQECCHYPPGCQ